MKSTIAFLAAGAVLSLATAAYAAEATGAVKAVSVPDRTVTLDDGKVYVFIGAVDLTKVKAGDKVKVTYDVATGVFPSLGIYGAATKLAVAN